MSIETYQQQDARQGRLLPVVIISVLAAWLVFGASSNAHAGDREQARRIHDRLVGTPPSAACLGQLQAKVIANNEIGAALDAITNDGTGDECLGQDFYRVTLKNFITPWTNEEQTVFAPLNDYTATVIGTILDEYDFRSILSDNILYTGAGITPAYSSSSNGHYEAMSNTNADLQDILNRTTQSGTYNLSSNLSNTTFPASAAAGVLTTRQAAKAFFIDGTNRAMFRFTLLNHLCTDLEQIKDTTRSPDRVRQDVSRSPGGDSRIYMNACVGCHAGMDPMTQAFAFYNFDYDPASDPDALNGDIAFTDGVVQPKYLINSNNFEFGYITPDDGWDNYWRGGPNSVLGWNNNVDGKTSAGNGAGNGASSLGAELANSEAFAQCQVEKVFKTVCLRTPMNDADRTQIGGMVDSFKIANGLNTNTGFNLKQVFAESAVYCMGD